MKTTKTQLIILKLRSYANPENVEGMARFGINPQNTLGVNMPILRRMAKEIGRNHELALELWQSRIHEARILAALVDHPKFVTEAQMESWTKDFDSWDVCDQVCGNLFDKTPLAYRKAMEWSRRPEEFVKRAGFVLMAALAAHDKKAQDKDFLQFFPFIKSGATDDRNLVKKAVNWALRQIGKRSISLQQKAIQLAQEIECIDSKSARWVSRDAIRELKTKF